MKTFLKKLFGGNAEPVPSPAPAPALTTILHLGDFVKSFLNENGTIKECTPVVSTIHFDKRWIPRSGAYTIEGDNLSKYYARHKVSHVFYPNPENEDDIIEIGFPGKALNFEVCQGISCTIAMAFDRSFHVLLTEKGTGKYYYCGKYQPFDHRPAWDTRLMSPITVVSKNENSYGTDFGSNSAPSPVAFSLPNGRTVVVATALDEDEIKYRLELTTQYCYVSKDGYYYWVSFSMLRGEDGENYCLFFDEDEGQWYVFNGLSVVEAWCLITR